MKRLNDVLINTLIFFFVVTLLEGAVRLNTSSGVADKLLVGILYGVIVAFTRNVIKFLKFPLTDATVATFTIALSLGFSLLSFYILRLLVFSASSINLGVDSIPPIVFSDGTISLLVFSIISGILTFILVTRDR
jgi:hypothetical protein